MKNLRFLKYVGFAILGIGFVILAVYVTMILWNLLIPELFKGPTLSFWQTAGLFLLSKILLTGVAPGGRHHHPGKYWRYRYGDKYKCWPEKDIEKTVTSNE
jgi:hypothetical protein